jgi:hypothetical protein
MWKESILQWHVGSTVLRNVVTCLSNHTIFIFCNGWNSKLEDSLLMMTEPKSSSFPSQSGGVCIRWHGAGMRSAGGNLFSQYTWMYRQRLMANYTSSDHHQLLLTPVYIAPNEKDFRKYCSRCLCHRSSWTRTSKLLSCSLLPPRKR